MFYITFITILVLFLLSSLIYFRFFSKSIWHKRLFCVSVVFLIQGLGAFFVYYCEIPMTIKIGTLFTLFYGPLLSYLFRGLVREVSLQFVGVVCILLVYLFAMLAFFALHKEEDSFHFVNTILRFAGSAIAFSYAVLYYMYLLNKHICTKQRFFSYFYICLLFSTGFMLLSPL